MNISNETLSNIFFIFGVVDQEQKTAAGILDRLGIPYGFAGAFNSRANSVTRVHPGNTYTSTHVLDADGNEVTAPQGAKIYFFETAIAGLEGASLDHHRPGDAGYGRPVAESVEASAMGQLAAVIGYTLTARERAIAAADHNLQAAYAGEVPGITAEDVLAVRAEELCGRHGMTKETFVDGVKALAAELGQMSEKIKAGIPMIDLRNRPANAFNGEAVSMSGKTVLFYSDTRPGQEDKVMLSSPDPKILQEVLDRKLLFGLGITGVYGDPTRGFLGGTGVEGNVDLYNETAGREF